MAEEATPNAAPETPNAANADLLETQTPPQGGPAKPAEEAAKPVVPEKYEFNFPDGSTVDQATLDAFTPLAKELGLSQEHAQKLVDLELGRVKAQQEAWVKQQETWAADFKADKDFGGDKAEASLRAANTAYVKFFTADEMEAVKASGLANFPPLVKALARIGKLMGEGEFVAGGSTEAPPPSLAQAMFPGMK